MPSDEPESGASQGRQLLWLAAVVIVLSGCLVAMALAFLRTEAIDSAERLTESFAQVIEEQTTRTLQSVDQSLQFTAIKLDQLRAAGTLNDDAVRALLNQQLKTMPFARTLWVTNAQGQVIHDTGMGHVSTDQTDAAYFKALQAAPQTPFLVGAPIKSRLNGYWQIPAARPLHATDGQFMGTIVAAVNPLYFDKLWQSINLGAGGSVTLLSTKGVMLARSPLHEASLGKSFANVSVFAIHLPKSPMGHLQDVSVVDQVSRLLAYRTLSAQPGLVVVVGQSFDLVLQPWRRMVALAWGIWLAAALGGLLLCIFLRRAWRQKAQLQAQAVQSAERLKLATDAAEVGVWDWDVTRADEWYSSATYYTMLGYEPIVGLSDRALWIARLHPDDRDAVNTRIQAVLAGSDLPYQYEARMRHANGSYRWVSVTGRVLAKDANGKASRLMGVRQDITDRKLAEEALRVSEDNLAITLQSIGDAVIATDALGHITRMNPTAERLTAWPLAEALGRPLNEVFRIVDVTTRTPAANPVDLVMAHGDVVGLSNHTALLARNAAEYQISDSAAPIRDRAGSIVGVVLVFSDVTDQYRLRQELAATLELLERTSHLAKVGGWELDIASMRYVWSTETCRLHDVPPLATPTFEEANALYAPTERAVLQSAVQAAIDHGTPWDMELPKRTATGRPIWVRTQGSAIVESGKTIKLLGVFHDITEQRQAQLAVLQSETRYRALFEHAPDGILIADAQGNYRDANASACTMLGYKHEELIGLHSADVLIPSERVHIPHALEAIQTLHDYHREWQFRRKDGSVFSAEVIANKMPDGLLIGMMRDVTARKRAETELRDNLVHTQTILDNIVDGVVTFDAQGIIESFNLAASAMFGFAPAEIIGRSAAQLVYDPDSHFEEDYLRHRFSSSRPGVANISREVQARRKDGGLFPVHLSVSRIFRNGQSHLIAIVRDITQQRHDQEEIRRLAFFDPLTGLPNRRLLMDRLKQAVATSARTNKHGALMFLDLDHFKLLNDTQGHDVGDLLLQHTAARLTACVRDGDSVARLGGDEFVVLLEALSPNSTDAATQAESVASKLLDAFTAPYSLNDYIHQGTTSIGIVLFMGERDSIDELLKKADLAMYQGKSAGRNTARFFDPAMQAAVAEYDAREKDLRRGIAMREFVLHYQIQINGAGETTGVEALVRWNHARQGLITPAHFIALAEQTGCILELGQQVLEAACAQMVAWAAQPSGKARWTMAVNVSASQFAQPHFVATVSQALAQTGANPHLLKLELTESILVHDIEDVVTKMTALKAMGVGFSLDDFGTGYSSLSYLKRLPLDQLKIDQSFVRDVLTDPSDAVIARTVLALGHSLGLTVIAEGVETEGQHAFLVNAGCDAFQGYYFGRPNLAESL